MRPEYWPALASLAGLAAVGFFAARKDKTSSEFFLAGRRVPVWAAVCSFFATEVSAATVLGLPAVGYRQNWQYLQFFAGSAAARLVVAWLFIPAFYRSGCTTIYEYLRQRFGAYTQYGAAALFFLTRLVSSGVRLMAASAVVSALLGWHPLPVTLLFVSICAAYTCVGGLRSVVWTNVFQAAVIVAAGLATLAFLWLNIEGGAFEALRAASAAGRLSVLNWGPSLREPEFFRKLFADPNVLWVAVLNGFFFSLAEFGTDYELAQRILAVGTEAQARRAMTLTVLGGLLAVMLFLPAGTGLFVFYDQHPELALPRIMDKIYLHFAVQVMPAFLRGGVLAAVIMASIDSPLASLGACFVSDFYRPLLRRKASERHYLRVARLSVVFCALALAGVALAFGLYGRMLRVALRLSAVTYGPLLGVFLYGLLGRARSDRANVMAMALMVAAGFGLLALSEKRVLALDWSWIILLGAAGTAALIRLFSRPLDPELIPSPWA